MYNRDRITVRFPLQQESDQATKLDLGTIKHLDFDVEDIDSDVGHIYKRNSGDKFAYCGIAGKDDFGHRTRGCIPNSPIPRGSKFCPQCGVKICPTCFAISQFRERTGI